MSELATLARPYAEAVFKIAKETGSSTKWSEMLEFMSAVVNDGEIALILLDPGVSKDRLSRLMLDICQDQLNQEGERFLKLLVQNNRLSLVPSISILYEKNRADDEGYVDVDLLTAYALNKAEKEQLLSLLEKTLGREIHANVVIDKSLIGGVWVRAGDKVIDGSIRGRLEQLAKSLN